VNHDAVARSQAAARWLLGQWLRARRATVTPADVGLVVGPRERPGSLTLFQVARLGGITARSYQAVEAARRAPGPRVLEGIITALPLTAGEQAYLRRLAHAATCQTVDPPAAATADGAASRLVDTCRGAGFATDHRLRILAANPALHRFAPDLVADADLLRWMFTNPRARRLLPDWQAVAASVACQMRREQVRHVHDLAWYDTAIASIAVDNPQAERLWRWSLLHAPDTPPEATLRIRLPNGRITNRTVTQLHCRDQDVTVTVIS